MDYPFENLNPERFQLFCQALLSQEFPDFQCFPVGQPDGGRDAVSYIPGSQAKRFAAYQVKFVRRPFEADAHDWLIKTLEGELPKVQELIAKGAERYFLLTNIPGTAHPEVGSIDRAQELLTETLGLPAVCWWRDDVNRKLDHSWTLKWVYPELMAGPDFLRLLFESGISEDRERRQSAVRAFLRSQYSLEEEVRFKQVELQNKLLDLFIDVPTTLRDSSNARKKVHAFQAVYLSLPDSSKSESRLDWGGDSDGWQRWHEPRVGAYIWDEGEITVLGFPYPNHDSGGASAMNNRGLAVGQTFDSRSNFATAVATLWRRGRPLDLNTLICADDPLRPHVRLTIAREVNDRGEIVAAGTDARQPDVGPHYFLRPSR